MASITGSPFVWLRRSEINLHRVAPKQLLFW
jgi:hypothetical protein